MADFSGAQFYLRVRSGTQKASMQNQIARPTAKQLENFIFVPFMGFIFNVFLQWGFCLHDLKKMLLKQ